MQRRQFLRSGAALAVGAELGAGKAFAFAPAHNWEKYDFGSGPAVSDRLNQAPFSQYPPDAVIPTDDVAMTTTPSDEVVPNYGKGLITYITADMGTDEIKSANISQAIEELVRFPLGQLRAIDLRYLKCWAASRRKPAFPPEPQRLARFH